MKTTRLYFTNLIIGRLPDVRFFGLKRYLLTWAGAALGKNVRCVSSAKFQIAGNLSIGNNSWVGHEVLIVGGDATVHIGEACDIGPRVTIVTGTHVIDTTGPRTAGEGYSLPIEIGDGCWIGTGAIILGGTLIGSRSIIAAGAVVRGKFPSGCLIGGIPAKIIKNLT